MPEAFRCYCIITPKEAVERHERMQREWEVACIEIAETFEARNRGRS